MYNYFHGPVTFRPEWKIIDYVPYPTEFDKVLEGRAYWHPEPVIELLGHYGKWFDMVGWKYIDIEHPRCYYCGKFVKKGSWWKGKFTGNCEDCYDSIY